MEWERTNNIYGMKKVILLILLGLSYMTGYAQSGEPYFCMTMQEGVNPKTKQKEYTNRWIKTTVFCTSLNLSSSDYNQKLEISIFLLDTSITIHPKWSGEIWLPNGIVRWK